MITALKLFLKTVQVSFALVVTAILTLVVITLISIAVVANSDDHNLSDGPKGSCPHYPDCSEQ
jgi:hypothetical protein